MDISWYGQACFKIKGKTTNVVIDPFKPGFVGLKLPKLSADIVLVTHNHQDHNNASVVDGNPVVISGPGEYEVKGVSIVGIASFHDNNQGADRGKNTIYHVVIDGVAVVHLGDLGQPLTQEQVSQIGTCDILMVPVGGTYTIDAAKAADVITQLEPSVILPMHYKLPALKFELDPVEKFLKEIGKEGAKPTPKYTVTKEKLPQEPEIIVLENQ